MTARKVTVRIPVSVDVAAWAAEYGVLPGEVRADVAAHLARMIESYLESLGLAPQLDD